MIRPGRTLMTLTLLSACGPQQAEETTGTSTSASTSTGVGTDATPTTGDGTRADGATGDGTSTGQTDRATSSTGSETTNPAVTTGGPTSSADPTGDDTTPRETGSSTSTGDETEAPVPLVAKGWFVDGAESLQIRIIQADPEAGICRGVWLTILDLGPNGFDSIEPPAPWHVRHVWVHQNLDDCLNPYDWWLYDSSYAEGATGTVVFHDVDDQGMPATIDLDVTGSVYKPDQQWLPASDTMTATAVPVVVG